MDLPYEVYDYNIDKRYSSLLLKGCTLVIQPLKAYPFSFVFHLKLSLMSQTVQERNKICHLFSRSIRNHAFLLLK